ncbi:hypothetical protein CHUAL_012852 [Chamberlinius hualienensis]
MFYKVGLVTLLWTIILYQNVLSSEDEDLWCLQCSWSDIKNFVQGNSTSNATGDPLCSIVNLMDITIYPPNPRSPSVNPMCTYSSDAYIRLLEGACYDYACYAQGKSCIKWTTTMNGKFINVTRMCAFSGSEDGCYTQDVDGYQWEVCVCKDQSFCNDAVKLSQPLPILMVTLTMLFGTWMYLHSSLSTS